MLLLVALNAKLQSSLHDKGVTALDGNHTATVSYTHLTLPTKA